jgi:HSP20 family protein
MELTLWNPTRFLDSFWRDWERESFAPANTKIPEINVIEADNKYIIESELPGLNEKDIQVEVKNGYLYFSGEKKTEEKKNGKVCCREFNSYSKFQRKIRIGDDVDADNITATLKDGLLKIEVPVVPEKIKKIEIKTS